jgi:hypothetical protein
VKKNLSLIVFTCVVLLILFLISTSKKVPLIPDDILHKNARSNEACLVCHGPGQNAPLKAKHPPKEQCLICHKQKKSV